MGAGRPRIFLAFLRSRFILIIFGNDEDVILELDLSFTELYGRMALEFLMRSNTCHNCVSLWSVRIESNPRTSLLRYKIPFVKKKRPFRITRFLLHPDHVEPNVNLWSFVSCIPRNDKRNIHLSLASLNSVIPRPMPCRKYRDEFYWHLI